MWRAIPSAFYADPFHRFITEKDFAAMAELGINTVRLPVSTGHWTITYWANAIFPR
jgi:aryl-phospho-beta-D-glucosidase BglC (GH1 family)